MTPGGDEAAGKGELPGPHSSAYPPSQADSPASQRADPQANASARASSRREHRASPRRTSARHELADFLSFVRRPTLRRGRKRFPGTSTTADWLSGLAPARLLMWLTVLWTINFIVLGPLAVDVADTSGVKRAPSVLPAYYMVMWAPLVEEMVFRFWLRRPAGWPLYTAMGLTGFLLGPGWGLALAIVPLGAWRVAQLMMTPPAKPWARLRRYRRRFPVYLHLSVLAFALLHLLNYQQGGAPWWLLSLLVLPQWFTGLVLAWSRVRHGIGAAIAMHAGFNALPFILLRLL